MDLDDGGSGASDTASDRPEMDDGGYVKSEENSLHRHLSSPGGIGGGSGPPGPPGPPPGLFPAGLEALYRQAGFPSAAFLGLAAATSTTAAAAAAASGSVSPLPGISSVAGQTVGLQSHAGSPSRKSNCIAHVLQA